MSALPRRLPQRGPVKDRQRAHHEASRRAVFLRVAANGGKCEAEDCHEAATDWAHLLQRRGIIAEPMASSPACTAGLCRGCHNAIDRGLNPDLLARMRWLAVVRLCAAEKAPITLLEGRSPEGAARAVEDWLVLRARIEG